MYFSSDIPKGANGYELTLYEYEFLKYSYSQPFILQGHPPHLT